MNFSYSDGGVSESCLYIDNADSYAYFVPLNTQTEWLAFRRATLSGGSLNGKVSLSYGCPAQNLASACGGGDFARLPAARNGARMSAVTARSTVTYTCIGAPGCGHWQADVAEACPVDGVCGPAKLAAASANAPTADLCSVGGASPATLVANVWQWTCSGDAGGTTATCTAGYTAPEPACTPAVYYSSLIGAEMFKLTGIAPRGMRYLEIYGKRNLEATEFCKAVAHCPIGRVTQKRPYDSPSNNNVMIFEGGAWKYTKATNYNSHAERISCER